MIRAHAIVILIVLWMVRSIGFIIAKTTLIGKDLEQYSLETVKMFYDDARAAGYKLV